jgi:hypothetical protein
MGHLVKLSYPEAPSGTFAVTLHGTNTPASVYSDFDCTTVTTSRSLNSAGRATVYVDDLVDVVVSNASGVAVDTCTEGVGADLVQITHPSWTGTLANGTQGLGGRLSESEMLTAMAASFGAPNGYVRETGQVTDRLLKDALFDIRSANFPYYNVRDYGALGDGLTDDTAAIQATISAAVGLGVVFVPAGTYVLTGELSISGGYVSMLGVGQRLSILKCTSTVTCLTITSSADGGLVADLGIHLAVNGAQSIRITDSPFTAIRRCAFIGSTDYFAAAVTSNCSFMFVDNLVTHTVTSGWAGVVEVSDATATTYSVVSGNIFTNTGTLDVSAGLIYYNTPQAHYASVSGNICLQASGALVGTDAAGAVLSITGNTLAGATTPRVASLDTLGVAAKVFESGNTISHGLSYILGSAALTGTISSGTRDRAWTYADGTSFTPLVQYKHHAVNATGNFTSNAPSGTTWDGQELWIRIRNTTGGAITMTWNAAFLGPAGMSANLAAGQTRAAIFARKDSGTTPCWRYVIHADST